MNTDQSNNLRESAPSASKNMPDSLNLVFRSVTIEDKARVLDFTAHTWGEDDGDYIQYVFDDWLADPKGHFLAAELDGQAVAIAKLTDLGEGELWLEGLRVDPAHRKKGIGEALHHRNVELARQHGGTLLRYATGEGNVASRMLGERASFQTVGRYLAHVAEASTDFASPERLSLADWPLLRSWLDSSSLQATRRLYARAWKWMALSESRLRAHLAAGEVFGLRDPAASGLRAWSIGEVREGWNELLWHHIDGGEPSAIIELAQAMRRYAADSGRKSVEGFVLDRLPLIDVLREAGYRNEDFAIVVLELGLGQRMKDEG